MFTQLRKHITEFSRYIRNYQYEISPEGILFPKANAIVSGMYKDYRNGVLLGCSRNLVVAEGLNHMLAIELLSGSQIGAANWYLGIFSGSTSPASTWTGGNVATNSTEITSLTQGYSEANRQVFTGAANTANSSVDNSAAKASLTIAASAPPLNVTGAFLVGSDNVRGGTSGILLSAVKYASTRALSDGDLYEVQYEIDLNTP
jgi:hypothetical protein